MQDPPDVSKGRLSQFLGDEICSGPPSPCDAAADFPYGQPDEDPDDPKAPRPLWGMRFHGPQPWHLERQSWQDERPEFIWGHGRPPAGLSATDILAKLCECSTVFGGCQFHPSADGMTDAQMLAHILTPRAIDRFALAQLGLTPDLVALVLRDEWTPGAIDPSYWARLTTDPPTLYRGYAFEDEGWRGLWWTTERRVAMWYLRFWVPGMRRLATYQPHGNEIVALAPRAPMAVGEGDLLLAPQFIDRGRLRIDDADKLHVKIWAGSS